MEMKNLKGKIEQNIFWIAWMAYVWILAILFWNQAGSMDGSFWSGYNGRLGNFHTDMVDYLQFLFVGETRDAYTYAYPIIFNLIYWIGKFTSPIAAAAIALSFVNSLTPIIIKHYLDKLVNYKSNILNTVLTFVLLFVTPIFTGFINHNMYLGVWSGNTLHNAPILATKGISIIAFFSFFTMLNEYKTKIKVSDFLFFMISMLVSILAKPTFAFAFFPAVGLYLLYELISAKGKIIKRSLLFFVAFIPSFIALIYQYYILFDPNSESKIAFGFGKAWHIMLDQAQKGYNPAGHEAPIALIFAILCGFAFPIFVMSFNLDKFKTSVICKITGMFILVAILEAYFVYEEGDRMMHGNFFWGYCHALFFAFLIAIIIYVNTYKDKSKLYRIGGNILLSAHLISGIVWFIYQFLGRNYHAVVLGWF